MQESNCYADGGAVDKDHEALMDHVALECMNALESKDKEAFLESFHVLVADILSKMMPDEEAEEMAEGEK